MNLSALLAQRPDGLVGPWFGDATFGVGLFFLLSGAIIIFRSVSGMRNGVTEGETDFTIVGILFGVVLLGVGVYNIATG